MEISFSVHYKEYQDLLSKEKEIQKERQILIDRIASFYREKYPLLYVVYYSTPNREAKAYCTSFGIAKQLITTINSLHKSTIEIEESKTIKNLNWNKINNIL